MMKNPAHPGEILRSELLEGYGLTIEEAAKKLGVSRATLSRVFNKKSNVSPELACRLQLAGVGTAKFWLDVQINYELAKLFNEKKLQVETLESFKDLEVSDLEHSLDEYPHDVVMA